MTSLTGSEVVNLNAFNVYLTQMLNVRVSELKAMNRDLALLKRRYGMMLDTHCSEGFPSTTRCINTCSHSETNVVDESSDVLIKHNAISLASASTAAELSDAKEMLKEIEKKYQDSLNLIASLEMKQLQDGVITREKEEAVDKLEEMSMLYQSESAEVVELNNAKFELKKTLEASERQNEILRSDLVSLKGIIQMKEDALAQSVFEKDEMEEAVASHKTLNSTLCQEIVKLEAILKKESEGRLRTDIDKKLLETEKAELIEQIEVLGGELAICQQGDSAPLSSQTAEIADSQQLTSDRLELMTLQAEKEDLEQQLEACRTELAAFKNNSMSRICSKASTSELFPVNNGLTVDKSADCDRQRGEIQHCKQQLRAQESQNTELIAQLLVLEDRLAEVEVAHRESSETAERLAVTAVAATDSAAQLQERVNSLTCRLETAENELHCCRVQLDLLDNKYSTATERYRLLLSQKNALDKTNHQLTEKLAHLQNTDTVPKICEQCSELEKLKIEFARLQTLCDKLKKKHDGEKICGQQSEAELIQYQDENVHDHDTARRQIVCGTGTVSQHSHTARLIHDLPTSFSASVVCDKTPLTARVMSPNSAKSNSKMPKRSAVVISATSTNHFPEIQRIDDSDIDFDVRSCKRRTNDCGDISESFSVLSKRQLFNNTSSVCASPSEATTMSCLTTADSQHLVSMTTVAAQNPARSGGRALLRLSRRSPKQ